MAQRIFTKWADTDLDQLKQSNDPGALIELAYRTKRKEDRYKALTSLDMDTYNALMILELVDDEELDEFLSEYNGILVPLLVTGRTLPVYGNERVYEWFANRVVTHSDGFLNVIASALQQLRKKKLLCNSKWFKTLLDMRFSAQEIVWLNYKMFGKSSYGDSAKLLLVRFMQTCLEPEVDLGDDMRKLIVEALLNEHGLKKVELFKDCRSVDNEANWLFIKSLVERNLLCSDCPFYLVHPLISLDLDKFNLMSEQDKFNCLDKDVLAIKTQEELISFLDRIGESQYLEDLSRDFPNDTLNHLLSLGVFDERRLSENQVIKLIGVVENQSAYECFMHYEFSSGAVINNFIVYAWQASIDVYRSFLSTEGNRAFADKLLQIVHDYRPTLFKNVIKNALANKGFVLVYGKDYMQQIYDKFVELWGDNFGYYEKLNIWSNIYDEDKVDSFKAEYEKEQQLEQSKRLAARVQSANDEITECMKAVQTYEDLHYVLDDNKYVPDESRSLLHKQVYDKLQELMLTQELDRYAIDIAYNLLDANVISVNDFVCMFGGEE